MEVNSVEVIEPVKIKGINYYPGLYLIVDKMDVVDLKVGCIEMILCDNDGISCILKECNAVKTFQGYYVIEQVTNVDSYRIKTLGSLPDYYSLYEYHFEGKPCITLKHTVVGM